MIDSEHLNTRLFVHDGWILLLENDSGYCSDQAI